MRTTRLRIIAMDRLMGDTPEAPRNETASERTGVPAHTMRSEV